MHFCSFIFQPNIPDVGHTGDIDNEHDIKGDIKEELFHDEDDDEEKYIEDGPIVDLQDEQKANVSKNRWVKYNQMQIRRFSRNKPKYVNMSLKCGLNFHSCVCKLKI